MNERQNGTLLTDYAYPSCRARLDDGREVPVIVPYVGLDGRRPRPLPEGTRVGLFYDSFEGAWWATNPYPDDPKPDHVRG